MNGWIKLHRKFIQWGWYKKDGMVRLFVHLLLSANHKENQWQGVVVKRGQLITGRKSLSQDTGMSEQSIRTCLARMKSTNEVTSKSTNKFSIITICNYEEYQGGENEINQQINQLPPSNQPAINQQSTTNKNVKKEKNDKKKDIHTEILDHLKFKITDTGFSDHKDKIIEFYKYRMNKPKKEQYRTTKGIDGLFRDLINCQKSGLNLIECMDIAMEKEWLTPDVKYFKGESKPKQEPQGNPKFSEDMLT